MAARHARRTGSNHRRTLVALVGTIGLVVSGAQAALSAPGVVTASFSGGAGTASVAGVLYAKSGAALTLNVVADSSTECVVVTGAFSAQQNTGGPKANWSFAF